MSEPPDVVRKPPGRAAWTAEERSMLEEARRHGRAALPALIQLWVATVRGEEPGCTLALRLRAAEQLADRCGMPRMTEVTSDMKISRDEIVMERTERLIADIEAIKRLGEGDS